jgi:hypothetical protein
MAGNPMTASEAQCEDAIIAAASILGYRVHAERPARSAKGYRTAIKGHAGFPDLTIAGHGHLMFVELKRRPNKATTEQEAWLAALREAGVHAHVWYVPEDQLALIGWLQRIANTRKRAS